MSRKEKDLVLSSQPLALSSYDPWILASVVLLMILSIVMVLNTSYFYSSEYFASPYRFLWKHLVAVSMGAACMGIATSLPSWSYHRLVYPVLGLALILLVAVLLLPSHGKVSRWIRLGPVSFQPSELAKWAAVLYLARSLSEKGRRGEGEKGRRGNDNTVIVRVGDIVTVPVSPCPRVTVSSNGRPLIFAPVLTVGLVIGLIGLEPDFGTAAFIGFTLLAMLLAAGARWSYLTGLMLAGVIILACGVLMASYRIERIDAFLNPWLYSQGKGFQLVQSFLAFGAGGITGVGLGAGQQKMFYLPEARTDFIFAVIGEELGLWGTSLVLFLFLLVGQRGLRIALHHPYPFGRLLAFGLTFLLVWQAGINMAVATGLLPTKGISLPLVSYGGSGIVMAMTSIGVLLALSREVGQEGSGGAREWRSGGE